MPVISVEPDGQLFGSAIGGWVSLGVGPLAERGLDEAFGLAVGPWGVGPGPDVPKAEAVTNVAEGRRAVAGAVVGHHPRKGDAKAGVVGDSGREEGNGAPLLLVGQ